MACNEDLRRARSSLAEAELARRPSDRYLAAHLAALRVVAIVLTPSGTARYGPPAGPPAQRLADAGRRRPRTC